MPRANKPSTSLKMVQNDWIIAERPSDQDCECAVLSGLVFGGTAVFDQYLGIITELHFTIPAYRTAFRVLIKMRAASGWAEETTLGSLFLSHMRSEVASDIDEQIMQLTNDLNCSVRFSNLDTYVEILNEKYKLRKLQDVMFRIWGTMNTNECSSENALKEMRLAVKNLELVGGMATGERLTDGLEERLVQMEEQAISGQRYTGIATGIKKIDEMLLGQQRGDLIINAGRPGMGKTRITLNDLWQGSLLYPDKLFVLKSLEMRKSAITDQVIAIITGLNLARLRCPADLTKKDWQMIHEAQKRMAEYGNFIICDKKTNAQGVYGQWLRIASRDPIAVFAIDYLQMLGMYDLEKYGFNTRLAVGMTAGVLKDFAKGEGHPVIAVSTVNRECESRPDQRPEERDLGESDMINYHADVIKMVYRAHKYDKAASVNSMELGVVKQRQGATGWVQVYYEPASGRITNLPTKAERIASKLETESFLDGQK